MLTVILFFLLFAFIHSITVSKWFKDLCRKTLGETFMRVFYRACYTILSLATAGAALYLIRRVPEESLWTAPRWLHVLLYAAQLAGAAFGSLAFEHLDAGEFLGVKQLWRYLSRRDVGGTGEGMTETGLVTTGVYGVVRHPLYLAGIIIFTCDPHFTRNGVLVALLADVYFLFGAFIEERRFLRIFGKEYEEYRKRVPRLLPRVFRRRGGR
jgi:uncharacterized membrane protein